MLKISLILLAMIPLTVAAADYSRESGDVLIVEESGTPLTPPAAARRDVPTRGMDMDNVRNVFGEPSQQHAAVGEPPITRWDYDGFSVFFEHDKVIHSVVTE